MAASRPASRLFCQFYKLEAAHLRNLITRTAGSCIQKYRFIHVVDNPHQSDRKERLYLTESCIRKLNSLNSNGEMLRVTVEGGGCSGFRYKFSLDKDVKSDDVIVQEDEAKVVIDTLSLSFLEGSQIDYHEELIRSAFLVKDNPNSEQGCSCGASFTMK
nr:iron-sulfur cluster assembly 2 [Halisarca dujardinii]